MITLVLGANGSGKSVYAEKIAKKLAVRRSAGALYYVATMIPHGEEGAARVEKHRKQRASLGFTTVEKPTGVSEIPLEADAVVLLEDVSNLLANTLFEQGAKGNAAAVLADIQALCGNCRDAVLVSIDGLTSAPEYDAETNAYIDTLNGLNHHLFHLADVVIQMQNGKPIFRKGRHVVMRLVRAILMTFSTYSRIPMPRVSWDDSAQRLAIAFLPLVGAVIGACVWGWQLLCRSLAFSPVFFAALATALPICLTGGIHLDGYCDTSDALSSWQGRERKLEILKDPHVGAFGVIRLCVHLLLHFALLHELYALGFDAGIGFVYALSRCLVAISVITLPNARKEGMLISFTRNVDKRAAWLLLIAFTLLAALGLVYFAFPYGFFALVLCVPVMLWYRRMTMRQFGGITGDTAGYYLQITELTLLGGFLLGGVFLRWL